MIEHNYASLKQEVENRLASQEWLNVQILDVGYDQSSGTIKAFVLNVSNEVEIKYYLLYLNADSTDYVCNLVTNYV